MGVFYLNYYYLISHYLSKRKLKEYAIAILAILVVIFIVNYYIELSFRSLLQLPPPVLQCPDDISWTNLSSQALFINFGMLLLCTISFTVSTSIRVTRELFQNENQLKEIENKKLIAELSYLKAQINPHFFFNTLNGIYALARQKSDKTPEVILMLSVMMRYIIYDAIAPKVLLKKELAHISNFIDLQKLRLSEIVKIDYEVVGSPKDILIEPLLFSVFVENAFKHGIDYSKRNTIKVYFHILDDVLHLLVSNPMLPARKKKGDEQEYGIGLDNIRKRLELLYYGKHELKIVEKDSIYTVDLKLKIEKTNHEVYYH